VPEQFDSSLFTSDNNSLVDTVLNILNDTTRSTEKPDIGLTLVTLALLGLVSVMGFAHNYVILRGDNITMDTNTKALFDLAGRLTQSGQKLDPSLIMSLLRDGKGAASLAPLLGMLGKSAKKEESGPASDGAN
jgi:hypothetical protein